MRMYESDSSHLLIYTSTYCIISAQVVYLNHTHNSHSNVQCTSHRVVISENKNEISIKEHIIRCHVSYHIN